MQSPYGIIPAYAGNTAKASLIDALSWDHPRVCGEHVVRTVIFAVEAGSSPRMRGTHEYRSDLRGEIGIIPAYAGNTDDTRESDA